MNGPRSYEGMVGCAPSEYLNANVPLCGHGGWCPPTAFLPRTVEENDGSDKAPEFGLTARVKHLANADIGGRCKQSEVGRGRSTS